MPVMEIVGKSVPKKDGLEKVLGRSRYGDDLAFHGMLHAKAVRSTVPHGVIKGIDLSEALRLPDVITVIRAEDFAGNIHFGPTHDQQVLADGKVRYVGDDIVVIAAETEEIAERAARLVRVEYRELPGIFRVDESLRKESVAIHDRGNLANSYVLRKGDIKEGLRNSYLVIERDFETSPDEHAYLEPEAVIAEPDRLSGGVVLYAPIQNPFVLRNLTSRALGVEQSRVRVIQVTTGGAFGGKNDNVYRAGAQAALLSLKTRRPVKMVYTREETFTANYKSPRYKMHYRMGATKEGTIAAIQVDYLIDLGAYNPYSKRYLARSGVQSAGPYEIPHVEVEGKAAFTNNIYTGAFRSFGGYQITFGIESMMDELSVALGIDPLDLRMRNVLRKGGRTITGQRLDDDPCYIEILARLRERSGWDTRRRTPRERGSGRGMGLALCFYGLSLGYLASADISEARISVNEDGSVMIASVYTDCGSGGKTALCQIAAEALGASYEAVEYLEPDTSRVVDCGPLVGSRTVLCGGNAVKDAATKLREKILSVASDMMEADPENLTVRENRIFVSGSPAKYIEIKDVAAECFKKGIVLSDQGFFKAPSLTCDLASGQGSPYFAYASGGHVAEVETDPLTGKVRLAGYVAVHNAGRVVNPDGFAGQIEGAVAMGMGCAVLEQLYPRDGKTICRNFGEYEIPTSLDVPGIDISFIESPFSSGPYGAMGVAEPAIVPVAPAIANAIFDATGRRINHFPILPEDIMKG